MLKTGDGKSLRKARRNSLLKTLCEEDKLGSHKSTREIATDLGIVELSMRQSFEKRFGSQAYKRITSSRKTTDAKQKC